MRDRLADVVQQRRTARRLGTGPELVGHHRRQLRDLDRMREHVLAVAGAKAQPAEQLDQLRMHPLHAGLEYALLAELEDVGVQFGLRLVVGLLDPSGMDPPVCEQLLQRQTGDLAADAVKAREHDGSRRVVDDEVHAGQVLQRPDVAALAPDDPPLHVVGGEVDDRDGRLGCVTGRQALHANREDVAHPALGLALGLLLDLADPPGRVVAWPAPRSPEQQLLGPGAPTCPPAARARAPTSSPARRRASSLSLEIRPRARVSSALPAFQSFSRCRARPQRSVARAARAAVDLRCRARRLRRRAALCVRPYSTAATTIPTAMSAAAPMISMVVPLGRRGLDASEPRLSLLIRLL